jgi:arylsulfatase A-like enzyme
MASKSSAQQPVSSRSAARVSATKARLGPVDVLVLSAWCGVAAGLLEVAALVASKSLDPQVRLYTMSRHFLWLVPLSDFLLFVIAGLLLTAATRCWLRSGSWLSAHILCGLTVLPAFMVLGPQVFIEAWFILGLGFASLLVPTLEQHAYRVRLWQLRTLPFLLGLVFILACFVFVPDWIKQRRERARPMPSVEAPSVLLIVLDTVRADHMSLYGYPRPTTPFLERLAKKGVRFDGARSTAPWTLPSHASIFTGRLPHELDVKWLAPLGRNVLTLAEYLGSVGYATAGFVANTLYCSYATGLNRGFTHYEDYDLEPLGALRMARLVDLTLKTIATIGQKLVESAAAFPFRDVLFDTVRRLTVADKKDAGLVNREFLDWLSSRTEPERPFFAFLNYFDTHTRYLLPPGSVYRFGREPRTRAEIRLFERWPEIDKPKLPHSYRNLIVDCYDSCLAYLDERLGELFQELQSRGVLDRTLVIVTADHGEGLGEHELYDHGESLYRTELGVPLLIVMPTNKQHKGIVREMVSLRNLAATVTDLVGLESASVFPGESLAKYWQPPFLGAVNGGGQEIVSELASPNPVDANQGRSPVRRGPLVSLADGDFVYIRNEGDGSEELFEERDDPRELSNRAHVDVMQPLVQRFRARLEQIKGDSSKVAK